MAENKEEKGKKIVPVKYLAISLILIILLAAAAAVTIAALIFLFVKPTVDKVPWWIAFYVGVITVNVCGVLVFVIDKKIRKVKEQKSFQIGDGDDNNSNNNNEK